MIFAVATAPWATATVRFARELLGYRDDQRRCHALAHGARDSEDTKRRNTKRYTKMHNAGIKRDKRYALGQQRSSIPKI